MIALHEARCFNHALREAVARCPECGRFFCRECVTEHDDRLLCARCLAAGAPPKRDRNRSWIAFGHVLQGALGIALLWFAFILLGQALLEAPTPFHEGTLWQENWWNQP